MGSSTYSTAVRTSRLEARAAKGIPVFDYDARIRTGQQKAMVADKLNPRGVVVREARDSEVHPVSVPIGVIMDTTGSMAGVPIILQRELVKLMDTLTEDKKSGKPYLGRGYPAIMVGAVDDFRAQMNEGYPVGASGALQVGQFESGVEIDEDLSQLWLTRNGGGSYEESYELALYFYARHTVHDHWEKRKRKGYLFLIGDEHAYESVDAGQVASVFGDEATQSIPLKDILAEVQQRYHVFFIIPNMTNHYGDKKLFQWWTERLGQQNVLRLADPEKICELIASAVAISEERIGIDTLDTDGIDASVKEALGPLAGRFSGLDVDAAAAP